jgi:hypothetical protein
LNTETIKISAANKQHKLTKESKYNLGYYEAGWRLFSFSFWQGEAIFWRCSYYQQKTKLGRFPSVSPLCLFDM